MDQLRAQTTSGSRGLYERLKSQIADGALAAGERLPSTRALAADLGVSRTTVTAVYEQLAAEGYVETAQGTRARVAKNAAHRLGRIPMTATQVPQKKKPLAKSARAMAPEPPRLSAYGHRAAALPLAVVPQAAEPRVIEFLYGALSAGDFPTRAWRRAYQQVVLQRQPRLAYAAPEGDETLRRALQGYLRRARGLVCDADQIVVVHGSQQGIDLCVRVLVDPGDHVLVEEPGYAMARYAFEALGAQVSGVVADAHGLVVSQLPQAGAQLVYVTPSHQFPLGGVMPVSRRQALLDWAQQAQAWVVEDDYDGEFRYGLRPVDSLQAMDGAGRVIYIGTFSKALSPQLRLGYLVLPPALVDVFRKAKRLVDRHAPLWEQRVLAQLIDAGVYERHVRRLRRANERRREALLQALARWLPGGAEVEGAASGLHLVVWIGAVPARDEARLVQQARALGAGVSPISPLYAAGAAHRAQRCAGLVLGYASLEVAEIDEGVRRLAEAVALVARSPSG